MAVQIVELLLETLEPVEMLVRCTRGGHGFTVRSPSDGTHQLPVSVDDPSVARDRSAPDAVARAAADIATGRSWTAGNRLQSFLSDDPLHTEARLMLGQLLLDMGAVADAGAVLIASERDDDAAAAAIGAWLAYAADAPRTAAERLRGQGLLRDEVLSGLGPIARARLAPVVARSREVLANHEGDDPLPDEPIKDAAFFTGCAIGCGGIVAVFVVGLVQIAKWLGL